MQIINLQISELNPYENNPRKNDGAVEAVANSIREFGFKVPIIIDKERTIVCGHTRYKAAKRLRMKEVPCIVADDLTEEQIRAFRLVDNKTSELADWDFSLLQMELEDITLDMEPFGFENNDEKAGLDSEKYTALVDTPHYEIRGEKPLVSQLYDNEKYKTLLEKIESVELPAEINTFLMLAATRHIVFNYAKIAEFYAQSSSEIQELFEDSALVIIDFNDAISNGWVRLNDGIKELLEEDGNENDA